MKKLIAFLLLTGIFLAPRSTHAQDFSNKGKEFWLAYSYHVGMAGGAGNQPVMTLYLTADETTTYTVEIFGVTTVATGTITAGQVASVSISTAYAINDEGAFSNRAIRVTSAKPIVMYSYITRSAASAATLCLPVPVLGREYMAASFTQSSNEAASNSFVTIVGIEDNTTVEIKPSTATKNGWAAGSTNVITLNKGQIYQILGFASNSGSGGIFTGNDLSGTTVRSIASASGGCKRLAVFSGTGKIRIPPNNSAGTCNGTSDNLYQQLYPIASWGKKYLTVPSKNNPFNYYRVFRNDPNTNVFVNGALVNPALFVNNVYTLPLSNATNLIEADQPISVAQYFTSQGCNGNSNAQPYDPDMIMLNPVEQNINKVTLVNSNLFAGSSAAYPHQHHIHVIMRNGGTGISSFTFDGTPVPASFWTVHPRDPNYSYIYLADINGGNTLTQGFHRLASDSGFNALAYGYANAESYGYSAGANVKDLYQFASIRNANATVNFPSTCRNTPFKLSMTFPYAPTQISWLFNGLFADVTVNSPVADSVYVVNGKTLYRYSLPGSYSVPNVGTYPVRILALNPTSDGCGGEQEINYDLVVLERPTSDFNFVTNGCATDAVTFQDASNPQGRPISTYSWVFGNAGNSAQANPSFTFPGPGAYEVKHSVITDIGCLSDTVTKTVTLSQPPVAGFTVAAPYCAGRPLTFTDNSQGSGGTITKWTWNFGDGNPPVETNSGAAQVRTYSTPGSYTVTLTVETASGCRSIAFSQTININPNPVAGFTFGSACLPAGSLTFTNNSTVTGSTLSYQWNFGVPGATSTDANPTYGYTTAGPFQVSLLAVSAAGCRDSITQTVNTVYAKPVATITAPAGTNRFCIGAPISFTGSGTAPGSTVSEWHWNFGDGNVATTQSPSKTYSAAGSYRVKFWIRSAAGCTSDTAYYDVIVDPQPRASFTVSALRCAGDTVYLQSNSVTNTADPSFTTYAWTVNGGALPAPHGELYKYVPGAAGTFVFGLTATTATGCADDTTVSVTIHPKPVPDFTLPNVCLPSGSATFTNTSTVSPASAMTYAWTFGDGGTSSATNPTHVYTSAGPFNVTLTATTAQGCKEDTLKALTTVYAEPQAGFTASAPEVCLGASFTFTDASTAPGSTVTSWAWTFDDGTTSTEQNPTKTFATPGSHTVTLRITSAAGCASAVFTGTVFVNALPTAAFTLPPVRCSTRDLTFTDASVANSGVLQSWTWDLGEGSAPRTGQGPIVHAYAAPGTYPVTLRVTTDKGCAKDYTESILVSPRPQPGFVVPQNCLADPFSPFTDTSKVAAPDVISTWNWNFGDAGSTPANNVSTLQNPQHRYTAVGPYDVRLIVGTDRGCTDTLVQQVMISGTQPVPVLRILNNEFCSTDSLRIKDSSWVDVGNVVKLEIYWDAADPSSVETILNPVRGAIYSHKYPDFYNPGSRNYTVRIVAYSGTTCAIEASAVAQVKAIPELRFDALTGVCMNVPSFEITGARSLNEASVSGTGVFTVNGAPMGPRFNPASTGPGVHTVRYTYNGNNGCSAFLERTIDVFGVPTVTAGPDRFILQGGVDSLLGSGNGNGLSYLWTPAAGLNNPALPRPLATPAEDITYTLTVTSADGCTASDAVFVKVLKAPQIPNVFTPNGDGTNDRWEIQYLESYPGATVEVYNRYGQLVYRSVNYTRAWDGTMNGKELPVGTYYYLINPKNGRKQLSGFVDLIR
ncbi:PKD domain-containing protein [Flaviaesturariibacter amylovorans]|uniref:PKD domain-containing protein n=1 Tax=Flaviaesturariibacter amylovorans TaxID=1084520 RepID=A0ABP8GY55_9BACT